MKTLVCTCMFAFLPYCPAVTMLTARDTMWSLDLGQFPALSAANLARQTFAFPQDFAGQRNLLLIGFTHEQQQDIDTWLKVVPQFTELDAHLRCYELPTVGKMNVFSRWFLDTAMRNGIKDQQARERTFTLYIDKEPFLSALRLADEKSIYAVLVDRSGRVLWRTRGIYNETKGTSLRYYLQNAQLPPTAPSEVPRPSPHTAPVTSNQH